MNFKNKPSETSNPMIKALSRSLLAGILLSCLLLLALSLVLFAFGGSEKILSIGIICIYIISTFVTGFLCGHIMKSRKYLWGILAGLSYFVLLFLLSFCFPKGTASTSNALTVCVICIASSAIGGMLA